MFEQKQTLEDKKQWNGIDRVQIGDAQVAAVIAERLQLIFICLYWPWPGMGTMPTQP